jgi:hypothetical protein
MSFIATKFASSPATHLLSDFALLLSLTVNSVSRLARSEAEWMLLFRSTAEPSSSHAAELNQVLN